MRNSLFGAVFFMQLIIILSGCGGQPNPSSPAPMPAGDTTELPVTAIRWVSHPDSDYIHGYTDSSLIEVNASTFASSLWHLDNVRITTIQPSINNYLLIGLEYDEGALPMVAGVYDDGLYIQAPQHYPHTLALAALPLETSSPGELIATEVVVDGPPRSISDDGGRYLISFESDQPTAVEISSQTGESNNYRGTLPAVLNGEFLNQGGYNILLLDQSQPNDVTTISVRNYNLDDKAVMTYDTPVGDHFYGSSYGLRTVLSSNGYIVSHLTKIGERAWPADLAVQSAAVIDEDQIVLLTDDKCLMVIDLKQPMEDRIISQSSPLDIDQFGELLPTRNGLLLMADGYRVSHINFERF